MRTIELKLYKFDELSVEAKTRALDDHHYINTEGWDWWEPVEEEFKEDMEAWGVYVDKILFNTSYSQGDYAGFEGKVDPTLLLQKLGHNPPMEGEVSVGVTRYGGIQLYSYESDEEVEESIREFLVEQNRKLLKKLYAELEGQESDEAISETLIANEYEFLYDGKRFHYKEEA